MTRTTRNNVLALVGNLIGVVVNALLTLFGGMWWAALLLGVNVGVSGYFACYLYGLHRFGPVQQAPRPRPLPVAPRAKTYEQAMTQWTERLAHGVEDPSKPMRDWVAREAQQHGLVPPAVLDGLCSGCGTLHPGPTDGDCGLAAAQRAAATTPVAVGFIRSYHHPGWTSYPRERKA